MPFEKINTPLLFQHFFNTVSISVADLTLTQPIGHLAALMQSNPHTPFKKNIASVIKAPYRGIVPAFKAKCLSRSFGLVIGEYCIPKEKNNIKKIDIIKAATAATGIETLFTTTYISQVRILQILKTKPNSSVLWQATKQSFSAHAIKNIATYLPVFWVKNTLSNDPFYSSAFAGITALLVQPITSVLDTVMTSHMVSAAQNQPKLSLQTIVRKHLQTDSLRNIISTRMLQYGLGYFISFYLMEKIKNFSQDNLISPMDPLSIEARAPLPDDINAHPPLASAVSQSKALKQTTESETDFVKPSTPLLTSTAYNQSSLFWSPAETLAKPTSHQTKAKNWPEKK